MKGIPRLSHTPLIALAMCREWSSDSMTQGPPIRNKGFTPPILTEAEISISLTTVLIARSDKCFEDRMGLQRFGFKLRMELASEEPGMTWNFNDLDQTVVRIFPGYDEAGLGENILVGRVELETVAVTLVHVEFFVGFFRK